MISTAKYLPKDNENKCPQKRPAQNVHSNIIHDCCQQLEITRCLLTQKMDILWYIHTTEYYSAVNRNELLTLKTKQQTQQPKQSTVFH